LLSLRQLLEPFQELPQLLDPYLPKFIPLLAEAYLEHLQTQRRSKPLSTRSQLLEPLGSAVCRILYTFCKVRGEKVVVRFLNAETKYLELILSALEEAEQNAESASFAKWSWHERYIVLLWLSHLLLAPFDLSTISSIDIEELTVSDIPSFQWPPNLPGITLRVLPLAIKYLESSGKECDAAKSLLVRIAMRKDMQQLGVLHALVQWAIAALQPAEGSPAKTPYFYSGTLNFLAGVLRSSADTSDMNEYLAPIFQAAHVISLKDNPVSESIMASAVARKTIIKVLRSVVVLLIRQPAQDTASVELIETSIEYLLGSIADNDTPVRLSASKALSIITLQIDMDMAGDIVDVILDSLNRNVLWTKELLTLTRDLSAVDPLEWHGLILSLAHLLYRRSPPAKKLPDIVHALLLGLSFEQRSTSGTSVGTNVRDAACFGIWALARRYTTQELLAIGAKSVFAASSHRADSSVLQVLGTELVVTASLDPAGNIRRGASAALQELIGRHPDTVEEGISVVQTVDYHAVALRSRAIREVATNATELSSIYGAALLEALLGWRGVGDMDTSARRVAGSTFGSLTLELCRSDRKDSLAQLEELLDMVLRRLQTLKVRQVDERHGLLLCFAALLDIIPALINGTLKGEPDNDRMYAFSQRITVQIVKTLEDCTSTTYRRPELVAEAASRLAISSVPALQVAALLREPRALDHINTICPGFELVSPVRMDIAKRPSPIAHFAVEPSADVDNFVATLSAATSQWLNRNEKEAITAVSEAALVLLLCATPGTQDSILRSWVEAIRYRPASRSGAGHGYFYALAMADPVAQSRRLNRIGDGNSDGADRDLVCAAIKARWKADTDIETRVAILQSIAQSKLVQRKPLEFLDILEEGLNDYTTNARGDIGSHVRLEALRAIKMLWQPLQNPEATEQWLLVVDSYRRRYPLDSPEPSEEWLPVMAKKLFPPVLRLAVEKLDRVRAEAHVTLALALKPKFVPPESPKRANHLLTNHVYSHASLFAKWTFSTKQYFKTILQMYSRDWIHPLISGAVRSDAEGRMSELLAGLVLSADTGNENLVIASRAALCEFCEEADENHRMVCEALAANLKSRQGQDRVLVPTLEIVAFLLRVGLFQKCQEIDLLAVCQRVQKAAYKTGNVRKLEACIKVYGGIAALEEEADPDTEMAKDECRGDDRLKRGTGIAVAKKRLGALMFHPWPRVRSLVVDEVWGLMSSPSLSGDGEDGARAAAAMKLLGVDWSKAEKGAIQAVVGQLGLS
jgi:tubulin-specific chaperone D